MNKINHYRLIEKIKLFIIYIESTEDTREYLINKGLYSEESMQTVETYCYEAQLALAREVGILGARKHPQSKELYLIHLDFCVFKELIELNKILYQSSLTLKQEDRGDFWLYKMTIGQFVFWACEEKSVTYLKAL